MKAHGPAEDVGNDADLCRRNGWGPGTRLVGDEGYGPTVIEITAVGESSILAKIKSHWGKVTPPGVSRETIWTLSCRDWHEVAYETTGTAGLGEQPLHELVEAPTLGDTERRVVPGGPR